MVLYVRLILAVTGFVINERHVQVLYDRNNCGWSGISCFRRGENRFEANGKIEKKSDIAEFNYIQVSLFRLRGLTSGRFLRADSFA
jgi:hypothetical protein